MWDVNVGRDAFVLYVFLWVMRMEGCRGSWYDLGKRVNWGRDYQQYETRNKDL